MAQFEKQANFILDPAFSVIHVWPNFLQLIPSKQKFL